MKAQIYAIVLIISIVAIKCNAASVTAKSEQDTFDSGEYVPDDRGMYHPDVRGKYIDHGEGMWHPDGKGLYVPDERGLYHDDPTLWRYQYDGRGAYVESSMDMKKGI